MMACELGGNGCKPDMNANLSAERIDVSEEQLVAVLTGLAIVGVFASVAFGGMTDGLLHAAYYLTDSGAAAGGASGGTGAVVAAGISSSSLSGAALAGAVTGGAGLVIAAGA